MFHRRQYQIEFSPISFIFSTFFLMWISICRTDTQTSASVPHQLITQWILSQNLCMLFFFCRHSLFNWDFLWWIYYYCWLPCITFILISRNMGPQNVRWTLNNMHIVASVCKLAGKKKLNGRKIAIKYVLHVASDGKFIKRKEIHIEWKKNKKYELDASCFFLCCSLWIYKPQMLLLLLVHKNQIYSCNHLDHFVKTRSFFNLVTLNARNSIHVMQNILQPNHDRTDKFIFFSFRNLRFCTAKCFSLA